MKPPKPTTNNGIRPGFLFLLVCALAGTMGLLWLYRAKAPATESTAEVTTAVESSAVVEPAFAEPPAAEPAATDTAGPLEAKWGIQVAGLSLSRADSAVELRYVVTSPEKTASLADQKKEAYLIELVSGAKIPIATPSSEGVGRPHSRARSMALMMPGAGTFPPTRIA